MDLLDQKASQFDKESDFTQRKKPQSVKPSECNETSRAQGVGKKVLSEVLVFTELY